MAENRMRDYKNKGKDATVMRGRRREDTVALRKNVREDQMMKKRNLDEPAVTTQLFPPHAMCYVQTYLPHLLHKKSEAVVPFGDQSQKVHSSSVTLSDLGDIVNMIKHGDAAAQFIGTQKTR